MHPNKWSEVTEPSAESLGGVHGVDPRKAFSFGGPKKIFLCSVKCNISNPTPTLPPGTERDKLLEAIWSSWIYIGLS